MKYSIKTLLLLALSIVLLAGCTNPLIKSTEPVANTEEDMVIKTITCDMLSDVEKQEECYAAQSALASSVLNDEIRDTYDLVRCAELPEHMIEGCQEHINESGIVGPVTVEEYDALQAAIEPLVTVDGEVVTESYDVSTCATLSDAKGLKAYCEKEVNQYIQVDLLDDIYDSGDAARCDELTDEELKTDCKNELGGGESED
ncbi:hypothetical protein KJ742_03605 [Patescibacteria group bacterium]|nr:hypothetical protein [Patescibacteria group bacterium]MBU1683007.1 hypothetical protein [Patescibacteria group bacterium]MBU1934648.1 hypothetical protein [Patescibacteria group bacterium]